MAYDKLIWVDDIGKSFTATCTAGVSGGDLLKWALGSDMVGSDMNTWAATDVKVATTDDPKNCVGMAMYGATSGTTVAVVTEGIVVVPAGSAVISGGQPVIPAGYGNAMCIWNNGGSGTIGRALSEATALTGFAPVLLNL